MNRTRRDIIAQIIKECLNELYLNSTPSISLDEIEELYKNGTYSEKNPHYMHHYLSQEEQKDIIEHFKYIYNLSDQWNENISLIYDYLEKGGHKIVYKKHHKEYEDTPPLKELIGKEHADKVLELIQNCKDFYRGGVDESTFTFNVYNFSPCTNEQLVNKSINKRGD